MPAGELDLDEVHILRTIAERLNGLVEIHGALDDVLGLLVELLGLQTAWLFLAEPGETGSAPVDSGSPPDEATTFRPAGMCGLPSALAQRDCAALRGPWCSCQELYREGQLAEAINIVQCSRLRDARGDKGGLVYHASVPLVSQGQRFGILNVAAPGRELFTDATLALLSAVGLQIGTAIERSRLVRERRAVADLEARHRLARDLHDAVSQSLFSLVMHVRAVRERLERKQPEAALEALGPIEALARGALSEMRALIFGLRRAELGDSGLAETLTRYARAQPLLADLEQAFVIEVEPTGELGEAIFRIVQEGLNNVIKHAAARRVDVSVRDAAGLIRIEVRDDGRGFAPDETAEGYGRRNLAERCRALGGRMGIDSTPGRGARLWAELPLAQGESAQPVDARKEDEYQ